MSGAMDRDPVLAAAFDARPVPAHGDGFWASLESELLGADVVDVPTRGATIDRRRRWPLLVGLAAAAAVLVVIGFAAGLGSDPDSISVAVGNGESEDSAGVTTVPTIVDTSVTLPPEPPATDTTVIDDPWAPATTMPTPAGMTIRGLGVFAGDGSEYGVMSNDADDVLECAPAQLVRLIDGGLVGEFGTFSRSVHVVVGAGPEVVLIESCEESFVSLSVGWTGSEAGFLAPESITKVELEPTPGYLTEARMATDGARVLEATAVFYESSQGPVAVRIDLDTGAVTVLSSDGSADPLDYAAGDGCQPGEGSLPDGEWYGSVEFDATGAATVNLMCAFFVGEYPGDLEARLQERYPDADIEFAYVDWDLIDLNPAERTMSFGSDAVVRLYDITLSGDPYQSFDVAAGAVAADERRSGEGAIVWGRFIVDDGLITLLEDLPSA